MPCFIRIFARVFEKARIRYFITPKKEEEEKLEALLRKKLEELSKKSIRTHQELKMELIRIQKEEPQTFMMLETWLLEQLRKLRKKQSTKVPVSEEKKTKAKPKKKKKKKKQELRVYV